MSKLSLLVAGGIGYVFGSRAGRERYEDIRRLATRVRENPTVQSTARSATEAATDAVKEAAPVVRDKVTDATSAATQKVRSDSGPDSTLNQPGS